MKKFCVNLREEGWIYDQCRVAGDFRNEFTVRVESERDV